MFLTVKQAAEKIGLSGWVVYRLCAEGLIRHHRIGPSRGKIGITPEAVAEYLQSCEVSPGRPLNQPKKKGRPRQARSNLRSDGKPFRFV